MPTVKYTTAKGLHQVTGTAGIQLNGILNSRPSISGLTAASQAHADFSGTANTLTLLAYTGATGLKTCTLPAATFGTRFVVQLAAKLTGTNSLAFDCAGTDAFRTGTLAIKMNSSVIEYDTSAAGEAKVTYAPSHVDNAICALGTIYYFSCVEDGVWDLEIFNQKDPAGTGLVGTHTFAA
jgi:hypothetical protein